MISYTEFDAADFFDGLDVRIRYDCDIERASGGDMGNRPGWVGTCRILSAEMCGCVWTRDHLVACIGIDQVGEFEDRILDEEFDRFKEGRDDD